MMNDLKRYFCDLQGHMMPGQLPGHDPDAFQSFLSGGSLSSGGGGNRGGKPPAAHEFHCEVCMC